MKVALVHDYLNTKMGGAERLFLELTKLYPDAPVYTLLHNRELYDGVLDPRRVRTSYLQRAPKWLQRRPRYLLPLIPTAIEQFDLTDYDVVISSSSAFAKAVITRPETLHICYCNTPMRFAWDYWPRYVNEQRVGPLRRAAIHLMTSKLRLWDFYSANRVDRWIANSATAAQRITKYYRQDVDAIVYPGADLQAFEHVMPQDHADKDYYVTLSSLTPYKKIDLAIEACNRLGRKLVVIGDGLDRARLEAMAGPTVTFAGMVDDSRRAELLAGAKAMLFPGIEDFGIAPIEAMACGTPVIGYNEGGLTETVQDGVTGLLFKHQTTDSLIEAIEHLDTLKLKPKTIRQHAATFDRATFRSHITKFVDQWYKDYVKTNQL